MSKTSAYLQAQKDLAEKYKRNGWDRIVDKSHYLNPDEPGNDDAFALAREVCTATKFRGRAFSDDNFEKADLFKQVVSYLTTKCNFRSPRNIAKEICNNLKRVKKNLQRRLHTTKTNRELEREIEEWNKRLEPCTGERRISTMTNVAEATIFRDLQVYLEKYHPSKKSTSRRVAEIWRPVFEALGVNAYESQINHVEYALQECKIANLVFQQTGINEFVLLEYLAGEEVLLLPTEKDIHDPNDMTRPENNPLIPKLPDSEISPPKLRQGESQA